MRDSVDKLKVLPVVTERGAQIPLSAVAAISLADGPPMLRSENARLSGGSMSISVGGISVPSSRMRSA
jgi:Cu(I)/Ag(I) efflux system membrane protein CusA/SilA